MARVVPGLPWNFEIGPISYIKKAHLNKTGRD
jgi:hypothetical protein